MRKALFIFLFTAVATAAHAQADVEYRWEIGAGASLVSYQGDFNGSVLKNMQPGVTLVAKRVLNPRMAIKLDGTISKLKGSSANVETYYPQYQTDIYEFDNSLVDVSAVFECNFWPYGTGQEYRGAKRFTPFIFGGLGVTSASGEEESVFTMNVPLGVGVKYKIGERVNLGVQWAMHFSLSDKLDGVADPYGIKSTGMFKNTDGYSALQVTLTYSLSPKCRTCHNANEIYKKRK